MHFISIKNWFHHIHLPERRDSALKINQFVNSEAFWALVAITIILATLAMIAWWDNAGKIIPLPDFRLTL